MIRDLAVFTAGARDSIPGRGTSHMARPKKKKKNHTSRELRSYFKKMRREGRKGRREGSSPTVIPQGQTQSLGEKTELCPVKEEERENCLD